MVNSCVDQPGSLSSQLELIISLETTYQPEKIPQRDMMEPPKFTQPLTDRTTTRGYSTHLFCSVRGFPQVSASSRDTVTFPGDTWGGFCKVAGGGRPAEGWLVLLD